MSLSNGHSPPDLITLTPSTPALTLLEAPDEADLSEFILQPKAKTQLRAQAGAFVPKSNKTSTRVFRPGGFGTYAGRGRGAKVKSLGAVSVPLRRYTGGGTAALQARGGRGGGDTPRGTREAEVIRAPPATSLPRQDWRPLPPSSDYRPYRDRPALSPSIADPSLSPYSERRASPTPSETSLGSTARLIELLQSRSSPVPSPSPAPAPSPPSSGQPRRSTYKEASTHYLSTRTSRPDTYPADNLASSPSPSPSPSPYDPFPFSTSYNTPEFTPPTSFSSRGSSPTLPTPPASQAQPIFLSTPQEIEGLFAWDKPRYPYPDLRLPLAEHRPSTTSIKSPTGQADLDLKKQGAASKDEDLILDSGSATEEENEYYYRPDEGLWDDEEEDLLVDIGDIDAHERKLKETRDLLSFLKEDDERRTSTPRTGGGTKRSHRQNGMDRNMNGPGGLVDVGEPVFQTGVVMELPQRTSKNKSKGRDGGEYTSSFPRIGESSRRRQSPIPYGLKTRSSPTPPVNESTSQPVSAYSLLLSMPSPRTNVPSSVLSGSDPLQRSMLEAWMLTEPLPSQRRKVTQLLDSLTRMINARWGGRGQTYKGKQRFEVDVFGSVSWGGETGSSGDLDMVILVSGLKLFPRSQLKLLFQDHAMPQGCESPKDKSSDKLMKG